MFSYAAVQEIIRKVIHNSFSFWVRPPDPLTSRPLT